MDVLFYTFTSFKEGFTNHGTILYGILRAIAVSAATKIIMVRLTWSKRFVFSRYYSQR